MSLKKSLIKIKGFIGIGIVLNLALTLYVFSRAQYLNPEIPFWYTLPWGERQLASSTMIGLLPMLSWLVFALGIVLIVWGAKFHLRYGTEILKTAVMFVMLVLGFSAVRIIFIASVPFEPLIEPNLLRLILLFAGSFLLAYLIAPRIIKFMMERGIVTDPSIHRHPGMVLVRPSARGGAVIFALAFTTLALLFVPISKPVAALLIAVLLATLLGYADDVQNTRAHTKLKFLESPVLRLLLQVFLALFVSLAGFTILYINNPFNDIISFTQVSFDLFGLQIYPIAVLVTTLWLVWMMNVLSWSNAIDGQYSGIISIAAICLVFLAMRPGLEEPFIPKEVIAGLALLLAGSSLGILPFNWHPSKIMWGFGAIAAGLLFSALAIATQAKISASVIVILVPFMDGLITLVRRMLQGKFPLKADKQHLHHLLLARGWSVKKIAIFYWLSTAILGIISIVAADKQLPLLVLTAIGVVGGIIILLNLQARKSRAAQQSLE